MDKSKENRNGGDARHCLDRLVRWGIVAGAVIIVLTACSGSGESSPPSYLSSLAEGLESPLERGIIEAGSRIAMAIIAGLAFVGFSMPSNK